MQRFERSLRVRPVMAALGLYVMAGLGVPALAQDAPVAAGAATASDAGEEEITVTARRRKESIQSTPVSVTAISPKTLETQAAPDIQDLEGLTPNLIIDPVNAGPSAAAIAIRGISFEDIEKSFDPAVGVLIDGIYLGTNTGQLLDFFDFESIEVLRGPQGTLFGRNTTAGVINITRTRPTGEFGGKLGVTFGSYGRQEYRAVVNLPAVGDVSTKVFYLRKESDGYYKNVTRDTDEPHFENQNYGVTFRYEPSETFNLQATIEHSRQRSETTSGSLSQDGDLICLPAAALPPGVPAIPPEQCNRNNGDDLYTTFTNVRAPVSYNETAYTLEGNYEVGGLTLTSVTGYRDSDESVRQDFDASSINFYDTLRVQNYSQFSQELRLAGNVTDAIDFVAGLYYFRSAYDINQLTNLGPILGGVQTRQVVRHQSKSYAAFIDIDWRVTENLRLSVGGRYTTDDKKIANTLPTLVGLNLPLTTARGDDSWSEFTPRVSVDYQISDDALIYASYSRGFRSGGFNGRATSFVSASTPYDPEFVDAYEIGAKTSWLDRKLIINVAAFHTDYSDKQEDLVIPIPTAPFNETLVGNAASATIQGLEFEVTAKVTDEFTISASLGLLDAEYDSYPRGVVSGGVLLPADFSNLNLRRTPEVTGSLSLDYRIPTSNGDVTLSASYQHVGEYDSTITPARGTGIFVGGVFVPPVNDPRGRTQALDSIDASATWNIDLADESTIKLAVFGRNLTDDRGLGAALPISGLWAFGGARAPRTYGVEIGYSF